MLSPTSLLKLSLFIVCALAAQGLRAQEAKPTARVSKRAKASVLSDNFSTKLQLRHYTNQETEGDKIEAISASQQVRASFKVKLLNKKLSASVEVGATKYDDQVGQLTLRRPSAFIDYKLYEGNLLEVRPFTFAYLPHKDSDGDTYGVDATVGLQSDFGNKFATNYGSLKLNSAQELGVEVSDRPRDKYIKNQTGRSAENLGWADAEEKDDGFVLKEATRDPIYKTRYLATAGFTPKVFRKFTAELGIGVNHRLAPEYRVYNRGTTPGRYETAYQTETESYNRLKLKYKISKAMNLANETYQNFDGFYAASRNSSDRGNQDRGHRLSNIVKLGYTF